MLFTKKWVRTGKGKVEINLALLIYKAAEKQLFLFAVHGGTIESLEFNTAYV